MMEDKIVRQYVRAVSRKLICSKATRSKLLNGLKQELSAYSELSYNELCAYVQKLVILSRLQNNCWKALTRLKLLLASASIDLSLLS